jgi:anti-anti-sigma factor
MEIAESTHNGIVILSVTGRLDASQAPSLEERVLSVSRSATPRLVIDLARLTYISSAGLRVLLIAAKRVQGAGGRLALAALSREVQEVFDIAGFSTIFQIYPHRDAAIASMP